MEMTTKKATATAKAFVYRRQVISFAGMGEIDVISTPPWGTTPKNVAWVKLGLSMMNLMRLSMTLIFPG